MLLLLQPLVYFFVFEKDDGIPYPEPALYGALQNVLSGSG